MDGASGHIEKSSCLIFHVQYFGALDGKQAAFMMGFHADVRAGGRFFSLSNCKCM